MPSLGDFFRLQMPNGFVEIWDAFLQGALLVGRTRYGAGWTDRYMTAPIWRFALAAGQAGPEALTGVLMPSVDRVGRQFPLTLAAPVRDGPPLQIIEAQRHLLDALETLALDSLEDSMTREILAERLAALAPAQPLAPAQVRRLGGGFAVSAARPSVLSAALAGQLAGSDSARVVFSTALEGEARMLALPVLPSSEAAVALFDLDAPFWTGGQG